MVSEKFCRQLREQARQWQAEGLISEDQYAALARRYQFDTLDTGARDRFVAILIGLGGLLLGIGAITLVAANWQVWSRTVKTSLLFALFVGINTGGFYLWRQRSPLPLGRFSLGWQQRLGNGLLLLGALSLGANMALMGQMFHIGGSVAGLLVAWGFGVLLMAYSLRLTSLGILAVGLIGYSYWPGLGESYVNEGSYWLRFVIEHLGAIAAFGVLPLAYWCRSRLIFLLAIATTLQSLQVNLAIGLSALGAPGYWIVALVYALPPILLYGYPDAKESWRQRWPDFPSFRPLARTIAVWLFAISAYFLSFHWFWSSAVGDFDWSSGNIEDTGIQGLLYLLDVALVVAAWLLFAWQGDGRSRPRLSPKSVTDSAFGAGVAIAALTLFWHFGIAPLPIFGTFIFNVILFLIAYAAIRHGLARGRRSSFWQGMVLLSLDIFSRVIEYDTGLVFKAFVFLLCGVGIVLVGLWFERHVQTLGE
ncbi:DUF2157 domain-containing protein [Oxynema sp. CENA135]|uniref:DUF2157 domain-containing protein n=1 Tax=Oxynema sp. CENA135 TaxID=984206 RepID=UPI00190AC43D|nr:DUF2157 domain-containing protein [Oxynema sp. CENA135]MBK4729305.1 DUF2157 domain-containing protein [Oxynema sp. CENA135]